ncbi:MAG: TonB-dependent receptor [Bacteroidales bacterium]|nr:TonB-dependent receptor [Bacteroidales bacterium]
MKKSVLWLRNLLLLFSFLSISFAYGQEMTVKGIVTDAADGSSLPGVTVMIKGTTVGTATDINGNFSLNVKPGDVLVFSYIGFDPQEITYTDQKDLYVGLQTAVKFLDELVVIGYGTVKKQDATGSVAVIDNKSFNKGNIISAQEQIIGKIPGVQVTTIGGAPGGNANILIRGGSSLHASNDPLIVIDGVPIDNTATSGARSTLSMLNPDEIESFTVLKDASATAIYGSRASNGVIIITTKKGTPGTKKFGLEYSGKIGISTVPKLYSVLDGDEFRALVNERYPNRPDVDTLLGTQNTNWQKEIYRSAIMTDHNLAFTGAISTMPYRVSVGYLFQDGTLKTDNFKRFSAGINLNPAFFDNHLKVSVNAKYFNEKNYFADQGAIGAAIAFDPSQPVMADNDFGGYWAWLQPGDTLPVEQATTNPLALLELREDKATANRFLGNIKLDYKLHFFPDLRVVLNLGLDYISTSGTRVIPEYASWAYFRKGWDTKYDQTKRNKLLDFYLNYTKDVKSIKSKFDVMAGYSYQSFFVEANTYENNIPHDTSYYNWIPIKKEYVLLSFYGRLNYTLMDRYLLTFTLRDDGSSKFAKDTRWGLFPSLALAWKINDEKFLRDSKVVSLLKLRLGYGQTGQQDIGDNWYPSLPLYVESNQFAMYQFGNVYYTTFRPNGYDAGIKWEVTTTWNAGLDFGFLEDRITGSLDYYLRYTSDLLNYVPVPAGTNLANYIWTNVGDMVNNGIEFAINAKPVVTKDWVWDISFNTAYNHNEITKLTLYDDPNYLGYYIGGISGGVGNTVQILSVGYAPFDFFVYQQVYDAEGNPIEGLYVDRNEDGKITDADRYHYKNPNPDFTFGIATSLQYKKWTLSTAGHAMIGNYVYNNVQANRGVYNNLYRPEGPYLGNVLSDVFDINFVNQQYLSDYYVQDASFFKLDYLTLAYDFGNLAKNTAHLRLSFTVNNLFTITNYKGIDPEVNLGTTRGIDNNMYPRSRAFVLGVNLSF